MADFSNSDRDVFLVKMERMIDRGALLSRYSRTSNLDIREVYRKEFANDARRGEDFYRRVFLEYGDESVAELVTAQVSVQNISNILTKFIEDQRIGLSYLEKSSRYVPYNRKKEGRYLYNSPEKLGIPQPLSSEYDEFCTDLFEFYERNYSRAQEYFTRMWPMDSLLFPGPSGNDVPYDELDAESRDLAEKSYRSAVRARALDDLRALLPASTMTNLGISGNGRSFIYLIQRMKSSGLPEAHNIADDLFHELRNELPELMEASINSYGERQIRYMAFQSENLNPSDIPNRGPVCSFLEWDKEPESAVRVASLLRFRESGEDISGIMEGMRKQGMDNTGDILDHYIEARKSRRDKVPRAFEACNYFLQIRSNFGAFRDIQRHRFLSISRPLLTPYHGYTVPPYFSSDENTSKEYRSLMERTLPLYGKIRGASTAEMAQYVVPFAFIYPISLVSNLRELVHFCELRSTPQSHYDLRELSSDIYKGVKDRTPLLSKAFRFVDTGEYALGRLRSEQRKERKLRDMDH